MNDALFVKLRDCFTAGYTFPQYCIDNGIKKPLFVSEKKYELFLWEIYSQIFHAKSNIHADFCFLDISTPKDQINFSVFSLQPPLIVKNISEVNLANFDAIILLTTKSVNLNIKVISLPYLVNYFIERTYFEIPTLNFLQRFPYVKLFLTNFPISTSQYEGGREFESQLLSPVVFPSFIIDNIRKNSNFKTTFDKFGYTKQEICEILEDDSRQVKLNPDGSTTMVDNNNRFVQHHNGKRLTAYQPKEFLNKIYIVGTCHQYGVYAPFDRTISSYLQKMLNEHDLPYCVENEGQGYWSRYQDIFYNLNKLSPIPNDIIFIYFQGSKYRPNNGIPFLDLTDVFAPPHDYQEIYCSKEHVNELGYKILAERYFKFLTKNNFFRDVELKYPLPPPPVSSLRHTFLGRTKRRNFKYRQQRT